MSECENLPYPNFVNVHYQSLEELLVQAEKFEQLLHEVAPHLGYISVLVESKSLGVLEYQLSIRRRVKDNYIIVSLHEILDPEMVPLW